MRSIDEIKEYLQTHSKVSPDAYEAIVAIFSKLENASSVELWKYRRELGDLVAKTHGTALFIIYTIIEVIKVINAEKFHTQPIDHKLRDFMITDHCLIRYMERIYNIDIANIKQYAEKDLLRNHANDIVIVGNEIVTILNTKG